MFASVHHVHVTRKVASEDGSETKGAKEDETPPQKTRPPTTT